MAAMVPGKFQKRGPGGGGPGMHHVLAEKPKDFKKTARLFVSYLERYKFGLLLVLLFTIGSTVFNVIGPKVLSTATTTLFEGAVAQLQGTGFIDFDAIVKILIITLVIYLVSAACNFVQGWVMTGISQKLCFRLRREIIEKIDRMPFGYFDNASIGDTLSRITNDVDTLGQSLNQTLTQAVSSLVTIIGVLVMMLIISPLMTLVTVLIIPISIVLVVTIVKRSQKFFEVQQKTLGDINDIVEETFTGYTVMTAFNRQDDAVKRFNDANNRLYEAGWKSGFISGLMKPVMEFVSNAGYVAVAVLGGYLAIQSVITVGDIQAFIQYVKNFTQPITQLTQVSTSIQQMAAAAERIFEFLDNDEEPIEESLLKVADTDGTIEFDHVTFGYEPDKPVIRNFSAVIEKGQTVALVGPTGAGKTTIVKLLMRFYDVTEGSIRIGGHDIREFTRAEIRKNFGMVLQDTWLFAGSVRDNIAYGDPNATEDEIRNAARAAYVNHFIEALPGAYDFAINEDAANLSQGQRQLLTIARAFLAKRPFLILDEATSSVDTRTEQKIQKAMDNLMADRTAFVIAHRLSTIKNADLILVIQDGDIVEQGAHEDLLKIGGFYAELYNAQFTSGD